MDHKQLKNIESFSKQKKQFVVKMSLSEKVTRTKLILLVIANTIDPTIGKGCIEDIESVRHMFEKLSEEMKFNL